VPGGNPTNGLGVQEAPKAPDQNLQIVQPPETSITAPLMYDASSEASHAYVFAISSGLPSRPSGTLSSIILITLSGIDERIGVSMKPGHIAFARMPLRPSSRAHVFIMPMTPNFVAA